jgi:hypothetical protein
MLISHRHVMPRLRMSRALPLLPLYAFMRGQGQLFFYTLQKTHCVFVVKTDQLILCREIVTVCSEDHMKHNAGLHSGKNAVPFIVNKNSNL